jgi:hypothetical protein
MGRKGIIMELRNRKAVVLTPEGDFVKIVLAKDHQNVVGNEVNVEVATTAKREFSPFKNRRTIPAFSFGAAFIVFCLILTNFFFFQSPNHVVAAYVSFDVNPSIEVSIDEDLDVIKVEAINEDAKALIPNFEDYYGKDIDEFANFFFEQLESSGYLNEYNEILVVTTVKEDKPNKNIQKDIEERINDAKESTIPKNKVEEVEVIVKATTYENHEDAEKNGFTTGKYITYLDAKNNGSNITIKEAKDMPIKELRAKAKSEKAKQKNKKNDDRKHKGNKKEKDNKGKEKKDNPSNEDSSNNKDKKKDKENNGDSKGNKGKDKKNEHGDESAHSNSDVKKDKDKKKKDKNNNKEVNPRKNKEKYWKDKDNNYQYTNNYFDNYSQFYIPFK